MIFKNSTALWCKTFEAKLRETDNSSWFLTDKFIQILLSFLIHVTKLLHFANTKLQDITIQYAVDKNIISRCSMSLDLLLVFKIRENYIFTFFNKAKFP